MEDTYDIFLQKRHDLITKNVQKLLLPENNSLSKEAIDKLVEKKIDELKKTNLDKLDKRTKEEIKNNIPMINLTKQTILENLQSHHKLNYFNVEIKSSDLDKNLQGIYRYKDYEFINGESSIFRILYSKITDEQIYNLEIEFYDGQAFKLKLMIKDKNNKIQNTFTHDTKDVKIDWTAKQNTLKVKDKSGKIFTITLKICNNKNILNKEKVKKTKKKQLARKNSIGGSNNDMRLYVSVSSDNSTDNEGSSGRRSPSPRRRSQSPVRRSTSPRRRSQSPVRRSTSPRRRSQSPGRRSPSPRRSREALQDPDNLFEISPEEFSGMADNIWDDPNISEAEIEERIQRLSNYQEIDNESQDHSSEEYATFGVIDEDDERDYCLPYDMDYEIYGLGVVYFATPICLKFVKNSPSENESERLQILREDKTVCKIDNLTFYKDPLSSNELFKTREKTPHFLRKLPIFKSKDTYKNIYIVCQETFTVTYEIKGEVTKESSFKCSVYDSIEEIKEKLKKDFNKILKKSKKKTYSPTPVRYSATALESTYFNVKYQCKYFKRVNDESLDQIKKFKNSSNLSKEVSFNFFHSCFIIKQYLERLLNIQNFKSLTKYPEKIYQQIVKNFFFASPVIEVTFKNETGIDFGGLRPKLFELLLNELKNNIFQDLNNLRQSSTCNPFLFLKSVTNFDGTKNKNLMNTMNQLGLSMENLYYIFGGLLARIILVENQYQEKVIPFELNFSYYLLYKFCNPSLVDHDWVDMLALFKLDSPAEYESLLEKYESLLEKFPDLSKLVSPADYEIMSREGRFDKKRANNKYINKMSLNKKSLNKMILKKTKKKSTSIGLNSIGLNSFRLNSAIPLSRRTKKNNNRKVNSSSNSSEETYDKVDSSQKLAHMYLRCVEFYEDNMLPEIYYFINGFKQGLQKHKFSLQFVLAKHLNIPTDLVVVELSSPKKDVIDILPEDLNKLLRSDQIPVEEFSKRIVVRSGIRFVSRTIQEKMKKYLISVLKEYEKNNPAMLEKVFIFWFSTTVIPNNEIKLTVNDKSKDMMINSHTCFNELVINEVENKAELKKNLEKSINGQDPSFDEPTNPNHL